MSRDAKVHGVAKTQEIVKELQDVKRVLRDPRWSCLDNVRYVDVRGDDAENAGERRKGNVVVYDDAATLHRSMDYPRKFVEVYAYVMDDPNNSNAF